MLLVLALAGSYCGYRLIAGKPFTINQLADRQLLLMMTDDPELFTTIGVVDGTLLDHHSDKLTDVTVAKRDRDYAVAARFIGELKQFDRASLGPEEQITYDVLLDQLERQLAFQRFGWLSPTDGVYPIAPLWGAQVESVSFLETIHIVSNDRTARHYVARVAALGKKLDEITAEMQRQAQAGVVLPLPLLERAEAGIRDTVAPPPVANPLVTTFVTRMRRAGITGAQADQLAAAAADAVAHGVYPAFARMTAALDALRPLAAVQQAGVGRLPDGPAYYALMLRQMTTTDYTPEEVHALGLSEVARITAEMDRLLRAQGLTEGSVGERMQALAKDPRFLYPDSDAGRAQILARYRAILSEVSARMPQYFVSVPPTALTVERTPIAAEKGSAGAYYMPAAMDGSRPGTFYVNQRTTTETPAWAMKTLAYHEAVPGHHFQVSAAQRVDGLPLFRQQPLYAAYSEGWALYAERLAAEIGLYKDDPFGDLGRLQAELFRAVRLVDDTGLHAKGWTREQAIDYMVRTTGMAQTEVTSEVERYMGLPGQACAYKVGQLKILELRERARAQLGPRFDLREFHAVVLGHGAVPLTVLDGIVTRWIDSRRSSAPGAAR